MRRSTDFWTHSVNIVHRATFALLVFCFVPLASAQAQPPTIILEQLTKRKEELLNSVDRYDPSRKARVKEIQQEISSQAAKEISNIDPAKVNLDHALDWVSLLILADRPDDALIVVDRALKAENSSQATFSLNLAKLNALVYKGDTQAICDAISQMSLPNTATAMDLLNWAVYQFAGSYEEQYPADVMKVLAVVKQRMPAPESLKKYQLSLLKDGLFNIDQRQLRALQAFGTKEETIAFLREKIKAASEDFARRIFQYELQKIEVMDQPAPALTIDASHGEYIPLDKLNGKVVLLDFFAHWCVPCKAELPEIIEVHKALKDKGMVVYSVTTYYGHFGDDRGISKEDEFARMRKIIEEYKIPWSTLYGGESNFLNYGANAIPHLVLIDKKGVVRYIDVGYTRGKGKELQARIEKLLAE